MSNEAVDVLGMSDADFLNANPASFDEPAGEEPEELEGASESDDHEEAANAAPNEQADEEEDKSSDGSSEAEEEEDSEDEEDISDTSGDEDEDEDPDSDEDTDEDEEKDDKDNESDEVDFKSFYEQITAEFKANNKMMKFDNPNDIVRLMQMGVNYNRKMAALKPSMKALKMLEKADLMSEEKLSYLIDLNQKRPEAIAKLLADSGVDPMDVDLEKAGDYNPQDHSVDEREIALDEMVDELQSTETFPRTLQIVSKEWDGESKQAVANEPQLLRVLNDHMASGIYDLVSTEIERKRMLGQLSGISDIAAYQQVGDELHANGAFNHLFQSEQNQTPSEEAPTPAPKKAAFDTKRRNKRKAASPSKPAAPKAPSNDDYNPLGMSDDEFLQQMDSKFL